MSQYDPLIKKAKRIVRMEKSRHKRAIKTALDKLREEARKIDDYGRNRLVHSDTDTPEGLCNVLIECSDNACNQMSQANDFVNVEQVDFDFL